MLPNFKGVSIILNNYQSQEPDTVVMALAAHYIFDLQSTEESYDEENDNIVLTGTISLKTFVDLQQYIALYYLVAQAYDETVNLDYIVRYNDAYGIVGPWQKTASFDANRMDISISQNIINQQSQISNLLTNLFEIVNSGGTDNLSDDILYRTDFLYHLQNTHDLSYKLNNIYNLGWHDDHFTYNYGVIAEFHKWLKHYPDKIIFNYKVIGFENESIRDRVLISNDDLEKAKEKDPESLVKLLNNIYSSQIVKKTTIPIWAKWDDNKQQLVLDGLKYSAEQKNSLR